MAALDVDAYARRLGCAVPRGPDLDTLRVLHEAHVGAIPFENLDVLLGREIALAPDALERKLVAGGRGGYCFEQNGLFQAVLEQLGYRVTALAARVVASLAAAGPGPRPVRPRTHMLLRVELAEGPFLADVGFGGDGPVLPLAMEDGSEQAVGECRHRVRRDAKGWRLSTDVAGDWQDLYTFTLEPQLRVDYEMANHFTSTFPRSPFLNMLTAQRSWRERRVVLHDRDLTVSEGRSRHTSRIRNPEHLLEVLAQDFGLRFPPGTRFPKPDF